MVSRQMLSSLKEIVATLLEHPRCLDQALEIRHEFTSFGFTMITAKQRCERAKADQHVQPSSSRYLRLTGLSVHEIDTYWLPWTELGLT